MAHIKQKRSLGKRLGWLAVCDLAGQRCQPGLGQFIDQAIDESGRF